ncbi:hypothetical protein A3J19_00750 [Candidatus Daviesbacteria bacterium RIFCSPLOWO2_02_FULL_41_8]|uniref:Uncharacterized protein n=1 Tax=Candidatus Daviesbacteria bacterium RIFCSPLOWO2_02_FULL_41_8 TaxID=1797798 RepID=A0A1F5NHW0_9BACT|nr:MAG: hypothetical protein A3J19_00750 [Candidatus Daviesbacteria bacterium RIFCSPLOWO2_02_FULL_41_8]
MTPSENHSNIVSAVILHAIRVLRQNLITKKYIVVQVVLLLLITLNGQNNFISAKGVTNKYTDLIVNIVLLNANVITITGTI